jgi:hypothetical protein
MLQLPYLRLAIALLWFGGPATLPGTCASFRGILLRLLRLLHLLRGHLGGFIRGVIGGIGAFISGDRLQDLTSVRRICNRGLSQGGPPLQTTR